MSTSNSLVDNQANQRFLNLYYGLLTGLSRALLGPEIHGPYAPHGELQDLPRGPFLIARPSGADTAELAIHHGRLPDAEAITRHASQASTFFASWHGSDALPIHGRLGTWTFSDTIEPGARAASAVLTLYESIDEQAIYRGRLIEANIGIDYKLRHRQDEETMDIVSFAESVTGEPISRRRHALRRPSRNP